MNDIPNYETFIKIKLISKGLSNNNKFYVETSDGRKLLLRVSDITEYNRKKIEFDRMQLMGAAGIPMSYPVEFGICSEGTKVFQLLTWCEGDSLEAILPMLTEQEQYTLGIKAGRILKKIHSVPVSQAEMEAADWHERYSEFMDESIKSFHHCGLQIDGAELILNYYNNNRHLLKTRPQCYLHNDYHAGNIMLSSKLELTVVDWEILLYNNFGDPWMEISMQETPHFSTGLIRGYFNGEPPEDYWRILAFYTSIGAISAIPWAYYHFPDELESRKKLVTDVLHWFENMNNYVPKWYLRDY